MMEIIRFGNNHKLQLFVTYKTLSIKTVNILEFLAIFTMRNKSMTRFLKSWQ